MVAYDDSSIPEDLEMRNIILNPQPGPCIDFVLVTEPVRNVKHAREAYGHVHPAAFEEKFWKQLLTQPAFVQSTAFTFFLIPILKYKIDLEVKNGWTGFVVSGLEGMMRAAREFNMKIAPPVAVFCFREVGAGQMASRSVIEQLFEEDKLIGVPVGESVEATSGTLLAETSGKGGVPESPSYSPSP